MYGGIVGTSFALANVGASSTQEKTYGQKTVCNTRGEKNGYKDVAPIVAVRDERGLGLFYNIGMTPW